MKYKNMDWLIEIWRIKKELSQEAKKMGLKMYLDFAEREAERIFLVREKKSEHIFVKDKKSKDYRGK